jgi:hypothetical protein
MTPVETLTLAAYFFVLIVLAIYGWHRYYLVYLYMSNRGNEPRQGPPLDPLPVVTIQLPLYNEMYVADRLINAVCRIEYPRELLEIQVLDDSTDETRSIAEARCAGSRPRASTSALPSRDRVDTRPKRSRRAWCARGVRRHLRRFHSDRGLPHQPDSTLPGSAGRHGAGALGHINQDYSLLTKIWRLARRALHPRARRPESRRALFQLQWHGG